MYRTSKYLVSIQKCYVFRFANILGASPPGHLKRDSRPPGALSGTPLHWHNDAMNYLVRGAKLTGPSSRPPPPAARYSRLHASLEAAAPLDAGHAFRFVQVRFAFGAVIYEDLV
jgi:hypothetical protein